MIYEDDYLEEYLQHHGIKGMKWGIRRPVGPNGLISKGRQAREAKKLKKADEKWKKDFPKEFSKVHAAEIMSDPTLVEKAGKFARKMGVNKVKSLEDREQMAQVAMAAVINDKMVRDKQYRSPSGELQGIMNLVILPTGVAMKPTVVPMSDKERETHKLGSLKIGANKKG